MKGRVQRYKLVDEDKGREGEVFVLWNTGHGGLWMKLWLEWLENCPSLRKETYKILLPLMGSVKWGNLLPSPPVFAKERRIHEKAVYRAYNELIKVGIVIKKDRVYYLSPKIAWRGDETGYNVARRELLSVRTSVRVLPPQGLLPPAN